MTKPADLLRAARKLLEQPSAWTQNAVARNQEHLPVMPNDSQAACWCMYGALWKAERLTHIHPNEASKAYVMMRALTEGRIIGFNDTEGRTHEEVLAKLDEAIKYAEARA